MCYHILKYYILYAIYEYYFYEYKISKRIRKLSTLSTRTHVSIRVYGDKFIDASIEESTLILLEN